MRRLGVLALCVSALPARAQTDADATPRVAVLEMRAVGLPQALQERFLGVLAQTLRDAGYDVIDGGAVKRRLEAAGVPPGCTVGACLLRVGRVLDVGRVVVGGVGAAGSNYDVTLTLLETERGSALGQANDRCEVCTVEEGLRVMGRAAAALASHPVQKPAPEAAPIVRVPPAPVEPPRQPWYRAQAVRWTALGLGVLATGVGIGLLAVDGSCASAAAPGGACRDLYDTAGLGVGLVATGVLLGAGASFLFVTSGPQQTMVGWAGRF
jgi:hypothetical protein